MKHDLESVLKRLDSCSIPRSNKIIKGVPLSVIENKSLLESANVLQRDDAFEYDILKDFYEAIDSEKMRLIKDATRFYSTKTNFEEYCDNGLSPKEVWGMIVELIVRIQRLIMVYEPIYYHSLSANKPNGEKYDMVKINWIDDNGKKIRKATKTYGRPGQNSLINAMPKFFEAYFENLQDLKYDFKLTSGFIVDLLATIGNRKWAFEVKATGKKNFIDIAVMFEMWRWYKEIYDI